MVFLHFQFFTTLNTFSVAKFGQVSYFGPNMQLIQIFCFVCQDWYFCQLTFWQRYRLCSFVFLFRDWPTKMFWGVRDWNCRKTQECVLPQTFPPSIERQVLPWSIAQYLCQAGIWMIYISSLCDYGILWKCSGIWLLIFSLWCYVKVPWKFPISSKKSDPEYIQQSRRMKILWEK